MNEFLIVVHRDLTSKNPKPSAEELKSALKPYQDWIAGIASQDKLIGTVKRWDLDGRFVKKDGSISKGPYAENDVSIAGAFIIKAKDYDDAVEIAKANPIIKFGATVEVRMAIPLPKKVFVLATCIDRTLPRLLSAIIQSNCLSVRTFLESTTSFNQNYITMKNPKGCIIGAIIFLCLLTNHSASAGNINSGQNQKRSCLLQAHLSRMPAGKNGKRILNRRVIPCMHLPGRTKTLLLRNFEAGIQTARLHR